MERQAPDTRYQAPCIPNTCFVCVTIPAYTWTADVRTLDAFQQKCLRQLPGIRWHDRVRSDEVLQRTGLTSLSRLLSRWCISVFGRVARLGLTPANMALQFHINVSFSRPPDRPWRRPPGRPRNKWLDQLRNDSTQRDLWRRAVDRGHGGATTRRPSPATRPWWWCWRWRRQWRLGSKPVLGLSCRSYSSDCWLTGK